MEKGLEGTVKSVLGKFKNEIKENKMKSLLAVTGALTLVTYRKEISNYLMNLWNGKDKNYNNDASYDKDKGKSDNAQYNKSK